MSKSEKEALKKYLSQYWRCKKRDNLLKKRHDYFKQLLKDPGAGSIYHTLPRSGTSKGEGAYGAVFRLSEIETRIDEQRNIMAKAIIRVMDVLEHLPADSTERHILELRHIDLMSWEAIEKAAFLSRQRCFDYYNIGLDKLLEFHGVKRILSDYFHDN